MQTSHGTFHHKTKSIYAPRTTSSSQHQPALQRFTPPRHLPYAANCPAHFLLQLCFSCALEALRTTTTCTNSCKCYMLVCNHFPRYCFLSFNFYLSFFLARMQVSCNIALHERFRTYNTHKRVSKPIFPH